MKITSFEWDKGNLEKLKKHQISINTVELFFSQGNVFIINDEKHSVSETRFIAFGENSNNPLFVVFTLRANAGELKLRVISARKVHAKELWKLNEKIKN